MKNLCVRSAVFVLFTFGLLLITPSQVSAHKIGEAMTEAANIFLKSLDDDQKAKATYNFDDAQRKGWHFIPNNIGDFKRQGLPLKEMKPHQQHLGMALLQSALSHQGYAKAMTIMSLEYILWEMENHSPRRDPALYHFFIFGEPSNDKAWAWRVEGHHLSVSFTVVDGQTIASTPSFFGANPGEVKQGPQKGLRALKTEEDLGRQLIRMLSVDQKKVAIISEDAPDDIINGPAREKAGALEPAGIAAKDMDDKQRKLMMRLVKTYVNNLRSPMAKEDLEKIEKAGIDKIHFAWAGKIKPGMPHYYRLQGPTFIMEYDNTQNDANHIHCVWRDFTNDFGEDLLKQHYEKVHAE